MSKKGLFEIGLFPINKLPKFIQRVAKKYHWKPQHKACYKNAFMLGTFLAKEGHSVYYCEAECEMPKFGMPYNHAWIRVDGVDVNCSSNGDDIVVLTNNPFKMAVVPIEWFQAHIEKAGMPLTQHLYLDDPAVQRWVSNVKSEQLTEHITWKHYDGYPDYSAIGNGTPDKPDKDLHWEDYAEREKLTAGFAEWDKRYKYTKSIMDDTALRMSQALSREMSKGASHA